MLRIAPVVVGLTGLLYPLASYGETGPHASPQVKEISAICTKVMGLDLGETYFANCTKILSQALAQKADDKAAGDAAHNCSQKGLAPGSAAFSSCVLDSENEPLLDIKDGSGTTLSSSTIPSPGQSFYSASFAVRWNRERYACASLGLIPHSSAFEQCVSELDSSFLPNPN
jgi:hypothetical protein